MKPLLELSRNYVVDGRVPLSEICRKARFCLPTIHAELVLAGFSDPDARTLTVFAIATATEEATGVGSEGDPYVLLDGFAHEVEIVRGETPAAPPVSVDQYEPLDLEPIRQENDAGWTLLKVDKLIAEVEKLRALLEIAQRTAAITIAKGSTLNLTFEGMTPEQAEKILAAVLKPKTEGEVIS